METEKELDRRSKQFELERTCLPLRRTRLGKELQQLDLVDKHWRLELAGKGRLAPALAHSADWLPSTDHTQT